MSRKALVLLVCCCDFRDGAERLIPSKSLGNAVIRAFPGLFRILRMCAPRHAAAVVRPRERKKSADRRRRILISRLLIIRASVPRRKSPFPAYFKGFPAVSLLIPPYPAFLKYPVSPQLDRLLVNMADTGLNARMKALTDEKESLKAQIADARQAETDLEKQAAKRRQMWDSIMECAAGYTEFYNELVRQVIQKITVEDAEAIRIQFRDSNEVLEQEI